MCEIMPHRWQNAASADTVNPLVTENILFAHRRVI
jgi:hypothetical protein